MPARPSVFWKALPCPKSLIATCAERSMPAMALLDRHGVYGAPRFHMAAKQHKIKAHVGAEISIAEGGNYPLLAASRTGYQNLCRLITTTKLRTPKIRHRRTRCDCRTRRIQDHAEGLICLTGDENGPLAHALANDGMDGGRELLQQLISHLWTRKCVRRIAEAWRPFSGSAQPGRHQPGAGTSSSFAGDEWRLLCHSRRARDCRRLHMHQK